MTTTELLLEPLKVKCTAADCDAQLHCFRATRKMKKENTNGRCRACGESLVDWPRVHQRDIRDAEHTLTQLKREKIRHHFWHVAVDEKALQYAARRTSADLRAITEKIIRRAIGPAEPFRDGAQTKREGSGNPVFYAQHATASCCRACAEEWHGIDRHRPLTDAEITYLSDLAMIYLLEKTTPLDYRGAAHDDEG